MVPSRRVFSDPAILGEIRAKVATKKEGARG
jgi:hypothetical protein